MPDTKSAIVSFFELLSVASIIAILSEATATVAALNSLRSNANETVPDVPPPLKPFPAVTPSISAALPSMYLLNHCMLLLCLFHLRLMLRLCRQLFR